MTAGPVVVPQLPLAAGSACSRNEAGTLVLRAVCTYDTSFGQRAAIYKALDRRLKTCTRFFAAAAWVNSLLGHLNRQGRLAPAAVVVLRLIGARLLTVNLRLAEYLVCMPHGFRNGVSERDCMIHEQWVVARLLAELGAEAPKLKDAACAEIDVLLNMRCFRLAGPLVPGPLAAVAALARQQRLIFAKASHRVEIGCSILASVTGKSHSATLTPHHRLM